MSDDDVKRSLGVLASLLMGTPFPSVYTVTAYRDDVALQCDDFYEGKRVAELWGLHEYDFTVSAGREFHRWTGSVSGVKVRLTASPDTAVGSQELTLSLLGLLEPHEALQSLAQAAD